MSDILHLIKSLLPIIPFLLLIVLNEKNNLKKPFRSRQCYMPIVAVVFCVVTGILLTPLSNLVIFFIRNISAWIDRFALWVASLAGGALSGLAAIIAKFADFIDRLVRVIDLAFVSELLVNTLILLLYIFVKRIVITALKAICRPGAEHYETVASLVYEKHPEDGRMYIKPHMAQGVTLSKTLYYTSVILGIIGLSASAFLLNNHLLASLYYPVFGVIMLGEVFFFLDGEEWQPDASHLSGEAENASKICDYTFMRQVLSKNFGDKLLSENSSFHSDLLNYRTNQEAIEELTGSDEIAIEAYGLFMKKKAAEGLDVDQNYLASGQALLSGKSVVFNNPFYYDLIPYIFFPMNRTILRHKKVLIVLGRHAMEEDAAQWCRKGLTYVTGIPSLWDISVLDQTYQNPDIGIVTRSSVHDLQMHENNAEFFKDVEFVVLLEPSRLLSTAQIGLNSLIRRCREGNGKLVFCSTDKNCDGLVDSLSHILMTSLEEVSATVRATGTSSYMCWEADEEHLQHRMVPSLSRYLGMGTELSFIALKNQISKTAWYGGEAFPVLDMHWITKQYYYDLLHFASLPASQPIFDEVFSASPNMWSAAVQENSYITVEDESCNMYEIKRTFATRAKNQGFVNVISTDYLLKDYMAANDRIFDADSKAIPCIVADYAHTKRNVIYRLCLRLTISHLTEEDIRSEMNLINVDLGEKITEPLWTHICDVARSRGYQRDETDGRETLHLERNGISYTFDSSVIRIKPHYCYHTGRTESRYTIENSSFIKAFLDDLCSAEYVAEDETDSNRYLGSELRGHVFQKYLPGQFFTFGGKYYEMLRLALDGRVIVRRAADHINGRPQYRQVRTYHIANACDSSGMGDRREAGGIRLTRQFADIRVETPAYWEMSRYNDFSSAKLVTLNGVPVRQYLNKQLLRIEFPEELLTGPNVVPTVALLMNELFRTLYAENQGMLVAVAAGTAEAPCTYSLDGDDVPANSLYIIEDSQLDIGLLVSAERNLNRIFTTIYDYLEWNSEELEKSLAVQPTPDKPDYTLTDEARAAESEAEAEEKQATGLRGALRKIGAWLKKPFGRKKKGEEEAEAPAGEEQPADEAQPAADTASGEAEAPAAESEAAESAEQAPTGFFAKIGAWLKNLFGRKKKDAEEEPSEEEAAPADEAEGADVPITEDGSAEGEDADGEVAEDEDTEDEAAEGEDAEAESVEEETEEDASAENSSDEAEFDEEASAEDEAADEAESDEEVSAEDESDEEASVEEESAEEPAEDEELSDDEEEDAEHPVLMSVSPPKYLFSMLPEEDPAEAAEPADEPAAPAEEPAEEPVSGIEEESAEEPAEGESADEPVSEPAEDSEEAPVEESAEEPAEGEAAETPAEDSAEEPAAEETEDLHRKPYHERYYLLYGSDAVPTTVDINGTLALLGALGFNRGSLQQARNSPTEEETIAKNFTPTRKDCHFCDFCGTELYGSEYEVLSDGRERCMHCGRTAVKTEEEFKRIFDTVLRNMTIFFGVTISAPVDIKMVNAKKLHKMLGKTFVPTSKADGRILGVAIRSKKGNYSILLENSAPRLQATMTIVHELTHIWQYLNWDAAKINHLYGKRNRLEIYEGMAKWVEIQYAYLINEKPTAKREELITRLRNDPYGAGFIKYADVYPLSFGTRLTGETPFSRIDKPL